MSGVMVERRDQVLIAGGFDPPAAILAKVLERLLSIKGPFLTERGIILIFRLRIADCGSSDLHFAAAFYFFKFLGPLIVLLLIPQSQFPNPNSYFVLLSRTIIF
jgi:hypothetical protein